MYVEKSCMLKKMDKKVFGVLFFSIFTSVTGVGIVVPLLPVYAHDLGATGIYIGLIFGAFSLSRTIFMPYFGRLSDKNGRKPYIVSGLFAYTLVSVAFLFANDVNSLIVVRFIQGIASAMMMPVIQAYVGDITPAGNEGLTMGMFSMSMFFGLSAGPLMGGTINDRLGLDISFLCMGFLTLIGFLCSLFLLPPTKSERINSHGKNPVEWKLLLKDINLVGFFIFRFAYASCIGVIWGFMPVFADSEFGLSSSSIGIIIMLGVFVSGLIHMPMGYVADRTSRKMMVIIGGLITVIAMLAFIWTDSFFDLFIANMLFGLGGGVSMPALMALVVVEGNKTRSMGSVMGLLTMAHSFGMLTGAFLGGLVMDLFYLRLAFPFGSIIMALGVMLFFVCTYRKQEQN